MFYHRQKEIGTIRSFFTDRKHALLVYGKRRVGKTTLINKALEDFEGKVVSFQCTSESYESNCVQLMKEIELSLGREFGRFDSFHDIFRFLVSLDVPIMVVLDEYNELKDSYGGVQADSMMQKIIDSLAGTNVRVILSGSAISVMAELLDSSNPLFDRFAVALKINEFDYYEASSFIEKWSIRDKVSAYSVFGGSPAALEYIDSSASLESNIKRLVVDPRGSVRALVENTLLKEFNKIGPVLSILNRIGNGKRTYRDLREVFDQKNTGNLSRWLSKMVANDVVTRSYPINEDENSKHVFYSIGDNLFRFYFTYVYPNRSRIENVGVDAVYDNLIKPSLDTYFSYRFEDVARQYFSMLAKAGRLDGIIGIGSYWYDDRKRQANGEFDVVLEFINGYDVFEVKFLKNKMTEKLAATEAEKIRSIESFKSRRIGFVSIEGFDFTSNEYVLIDGNMLFSVTS